MSHELVPAEPPELGTPMSPANQSKEALNLLALRRSTPIKMMTAPGPDQDQLNAILKLSLRVPDHRRVEPWRLVVIQGEARQKLGEALSEIRKGRGEDSACIQEDKDRFLRAPICVMVVASPNTNHKTPVWEQLMSAGAVCMNMLLAANSMGWAACWLSEWCSEDDAAKPILGLSESESVAGFIYIGSARENPLERPRPSIEKKISFWSETQ